MTDAGALTAAIAKSLLQPGRNCWRVERANRAALIVDAANYYRTALEAMVEAKSQIILIGWDIEHLGVEPGEVAMLRRDRIAGPADRALARERTDLASVRPAKSEQGKAGYGQDRSAGP